MIDRRATRVVRADDADDRVVVDVGAGVLGALRLVPLAGGGGRVVERLELDVVVAGLVVGLLEDELDRADHLLGLHAVRALQRQVGDDLERASPPPLAVAAAARENHGQRDERARRGVQGFRDFSTAPPLGGRVIDVLPARAEARADERKYGRFRIEKQPGAADLTKRNVPALCGRRPPGATRLRSAEPRRSGGTGRRAGLKIRFPSGSVGSTPTFGTQSSCWTRGLDSHSPGRERPQEPVWWRRAAPPAGSAGGGSGGLVRVPTTSAAAKAPTAGPRRRRSSP